MKKHVFRKPSPSTHLLVFETGDEVMAHLEAYAREQQLPAAQLSAIGAFEEAELGYFDPERREYATFMIDEQVEVLSLLGSLSWFEGQPRIHAHVVVGFHDGRTQGGHLVRAKVRPTLELFLTVLPERLERRIEPESGLPLLGGMP